jgi:hypothetical protein
MKQIRRRYQRLHPDSVKAVRAAVKRDWPTIRSAADLRRFALDRGLGEIYAGTGECFVVVREGSADAHRLTRLALSIGYAGPILDEVAA